jgi:hypothetical protein
MRVHRRTASKHKIWVVPLGAADLDAIVQGSTYCEEKWFDLSNEDGSRNEQSREIVYIYGMELHMA